MIGRSSVWYERTPYTNESMFLLSVAARLLSWLYTACDGGLPITSPNQVNSDSSSLSSGFLHRRYLARNAQMERAETRMAGFLSAQSARMRLIFAKLIRTSFSRDGVSEIP